MAVYMKRMDQVEKTCSAIMSTLDNLVKKLNPDQTADASISGFNNSHVILKPAATLNELDELCSHEHVIPLLLSHTSSDSAGTTIRRMLKFLMKKNVAMQFSFTGLGAKRRRSKLEFRTHRAYFLMLDALNRTAFSKLGHRKINSFIMNSLRNCGDWDGRSNGRKQVQLNEQEEDNNISVLEDDFSENDISQACSEEMLAESTSEPTSSSPNIKLAGPYNLKKETHCTTILDQLMRDESFTDVILTADGKSLRAHRVVLSSASSYFREVLSRDSNVQSIVLLRDVKFSELKNIINFIYTGEVTVDATELESFMKTANLLQISSLCDQPDDLGCSSSCSDSQPCSTSQPHSDPPNNSVSTSTHTTRRSVKRPRKHHSNQRRLKASRVDGELYEKISIKEEIRETEDNEEDSCDVNNEYFVVMSNINSEDMKVETEQQSDDNLDDNCDQDQVHDDNITRDSQLSLTDFRTSFSCISSDSEVDREEVCPVAT